jgi:hypothetical protein
MKISASFLALLLLATWPATVHAAQDRPNDGDLDAIIRQLTSRKRPAATAEFAPRAQAEAAPDTCGMAPSLLTTIRGSDRRSFPVALEGQRAGAATRVLLLRPSRLTVDADGAARAYHPEDPLAECAGSNDSHHACALDNVANAGMRLFRGGERLKASRSGPLDEARLDFERSWHDLWQLMKDRKLKPFRLSGIVGPDGPKGYNLFHWSERNLTLAFKTEIVPQTKDGYPCMAAVNGGSGYFISATTLKLPSPARKDGCRPRQFVDSERIPFVVLPAERLGGVALGDIVVGVLKRDENYRIAFGVAGDTGSFDRFGEASIAFNAALLGRSTPPAGGQEVDSLDIRVPGDGYLALLAFGGTARLVGKRLSAERVAKVGSKIFSEWNGGTDLQGGRLERCLSTAGSIQDE